MSRIVLFPGAFKPPHHGHVSALAQALKLFPQADVRVLISQKDRDGWTSQDSMRIWHYLWPGVQCIVVKSPVKHAIDHARASTNVIILCSDKSDVHPYSSLPGDQLLVVKSDAVLVHSTDIRTRFLDAEEYLAWLKKNAPAGVQAETKK